MAPEDRDMNGKVITLALVITSAASGPDMDLAP